MHIIIDGYNLIGIDHGNLRAERDALVAMLVRYHQRSGHAITVVFDGWAGGPGRENTIRTGGISVVYSGIGEKADAVIKRIISARNYKWAVVSSDRDIEAHAWRCASVPVPADRFAAVLLRISGDAGASPAGRLGGGNDEDEEEEGRRNVGKVSRKQRELERVMQKLRLSLRDVSG